MPKPIASLLLLVGGIAIGIVVALALGSGAGPTMAQGILVVPAGEGGARGMDQVLERPVGLGSRSAAEAKLAAVDEPQEPALSSSTLNEIATLAATSMDEDASLDAGADATERARMITGMVVDERGEPISGATVETDAEADSPGIRTSSSASRGRGWTGEADLARTLQERARAELRSRRARRIAITDEAGAFTLAGLEPGRHSVRAYAEGLSFGSQRVFTGQSTTLRGEIVTGFTLELVGPDGEVLPSGVIEVKGGYRSSFYDWTPAEPTIRLTEDSAELRAFAGDVAMMKRDSDPFSELASEARRVTLATDGAGPHRFELEPTRSVLITVVDSTSDGPVVPPTVRYAEAAKVREAGGRSEFLKASKTVSVREDGRFPIVGLEEGDYLVGVGRGVSEPEVFAEFTLASTPVREEIVLGPLSPERYLIVRVTNSRGVSLSGLRFKLLTSSGDKTSSRDVTAHERARGEFWLGWDRDANFWGSPVSLSIENPGLGAVVRGVTRDQKTLDVTLEDPCDLTVALVADAETSYDVYVNPKASVNGTEEMSLLQMKPEVTKGGGRAVFRGIQPGLVEITVRKQSQENRWSGGAILARQELVLYSGETTTTLVVSELFTLSVYAPDEPEGTRFWAGPAPNQPEGSLVGYAAGRLDAEHRMELPGLAAGRYHLSVNSNDGAAPVEVTVPSGVFTYERPTTLGYRVRKRRNSSEIEPLMVGDVITKVNGASVSVGSLNDRINLALAEGKATLTVWRDEETVEVVLEERANNVRYDPVTSLD